MERNIILDCDCVIIDYYKGFHNFAQQSLQREVTEQKGVYNLKQRFSLNNDEFLIVQKHTVKHFNEFPFLEGAIEAVKTLQDSGLKIRLVTGIHDKLADMRLDNFRQVGLTPDSIDCVFDGHHSKEAMIRKYYQPIAIADDRIQHLYDARDLVQHKVWINNGDDQKGYEDKRSFITHEFTSLHDWVKTHPEIFIQQEPEVAPVRKMRMGR